MDKCLPFIQKEPSLIPQIYVKCLGMMAHTTSLSTREAKTGRWMGVGTIDPHPHFGRTDELLVKWETLSQNKMEDLNNGSVDKMLSVQALKLEFSSPAPT